jgi:Helitron helicase-like domain at N-terminus
MAICRTYHKPDLFITMTCNPNWPEITSALLPGQKPEDRPDIVSRVFNLKKDALLKDIKKNKIFGQVAAMVYTIEFQKRGLPHMHLLLFLAPEHKIRTPADVDAVSCAQIPDPNVNPLLHKTVTTCMLHSCDPKKCIKDGKCSKNFPKTFCT